MTLIDKLHELERLDQLIRLKATGSTEELSSKLNKSKRSIYQLISLMQEIGASIKYCVNNRSYIYEYDIDFSIGFEKNKDLNVGFDFNNSLQNIYT